MMGDYPITPPRRGGVGGWIQTLEYDAYTKIDGMRWLRVKGSFSSDKRYPREDWVLDSPVLTESVTIHLGHRDAAAWTASGRPVGSRDEAMRTQHRQALATAVRKLEETRQREWDLKAAVDALSRACG